MIVQAPSEYKPTTPTRGRHEVWYWGDVSAADELDLDRGAAAFHTVVTVIDGDIHGELLRWASDGEIGYEAGISGLPETVGISAVVIYEVDMMIGLASVAADLRYEWRRIVDDFPEDLQRPETDPFSAAYGEEVQLPVEKVDD